MIYAEYTLCGKIECEWFDTWEAFHRATFCPDIEVKFLQERNTKGERIWEKSRICLS